MPQNLSKSRYPDNWPKISLSIKQREGWHCYRCGVRGLRPGEKLFSAKDRAFLIQVHHWDGDPGNNSPDNLVALCTVCHLHMHRQRHGSIAIGQGVLPFNVERRFPGRSAPRIPLAVQLDLWKKGSQWRQLELLE